MVAKQAGQAAGGFVGGIANNPGIVAIAGIAITVISLLLIFRKDIQTFFGGLGQIELPAINLPTINLPDITFPTFEFPEITFPSLPDITFPDFNFNLPSLPEIPGVPEPFVEPERMDVPFPTEEDPERTIDIVPDVTGGIADRLRQVITPSVVPAPDQEFILLEETQAGFQERAAAFVQALPEVTAFTSLPGSLTDLVRRQLSRESEDFEDVLAAEARRSETIFAGLFGNVQNPEFGA